MRDVTHFSIKGKLALQYVGPFEIIERNKDIAYHLNLPPLLSHVYNVFNVSMLKKYTSDLSHIFSYAEIPL